ncbi:MAG TPA: hypothetical protein VNW06_11325 [Cytophagaceae bacterium]|jgi:hypothetical protein|nr:hypothetical protein [Cytophagaceae bacterium]
MKTILFCILLVTSVFGLEGCKSSNTLTNKKPEINTIGQVTRNNTTLLWTNHEPSERYTLLSIDSTGKIKVLAAQSLEPEFLKNIQLDSNVNIQGKTDVTFLLKSQAELAKLNNKSASLLITREALYRLAEAYFNGLVDSSRYAQLYNRILAQSIELASTELDLEEAKAETIVAETEKAKVELQKAQLEFEKLKFEKGIREEKALMKDTVVVKPAEEK